MKPETVEDHGICQMKPNTGDSAMTFRVGMKVVCIDDGPSWMGIIPPLKRGCVYTVAGLDTRGLSYGELGLWLTEVRAIGDQFHFDSFRTSRFRPAVSPKSEISFTQGAPLDSEQWDNRRLPARVKEWGASASLRARMSEVAG